MKWLDELLDISAASWARRIAFSALVGVGYVMTVMGSIFFEKLPAIPYGFIPDIRFPALFLSGFFCGLGAAGGPASRRGMAIASTVVLILAFHLEEATVHWIGPFPGSITGSRVGVLGTAGSLLALLGLVLLHVEVESQKLAKDLTQRGASETGAWGLAEGLRGLGTRRAGAIAAGVAALGLLVAAGERIFGNDAKGGAYVLVLGAALLVVLGVVLARLVPRGA